MSNPILGKEEFPKISFFKPKPSSEPGVALVLYRDNGSSMALQPGHTLTSGDIAWGNYKGFYRVDVAEHNFYFQVSLPCERDAFSFEANVDVTYYIAHPNIIVDRQIKDPEAVIKTHLIEVMRTISRKYTTKDSEKAEKAINREFGSGMLVSGIAATKIISDLRLDAKAQEHLRQLEEIDNEKIRQKAEHDLNLMRDQFEIERQKMKMEFYTPLIQQGQWQLLALHLAQNPGDVATIANLINQQRKIDFDNQLSALKAFLDGDVIEGFQVEGVAKQVLQRLVDNLGVSEGKNLLEDGSAKKQLPKDE